MNSVIAVSNQNVWDTYMDERCPFPKAVRQKQFKEMFERLERRQDIVSPNGDYIDQESTQPGTELKELLRQTGIEPVEVVSNNQ